MDTREVAISGMREGGIEGDTMASAASLQPEGGREGGEGLASVRWSELTHPKVVRHKLSNEHVETKWHSR
jgi:hypothetical protein